MQDILFARGIFAQDSDSHWYFIPIELKAQWQEMTQNDIAFDDYDASDSFNEVFAQYRCLHPANYLVTIVTSPV
jgi:hypothetical protein